MTRIRNTLLIAAILTLAAFAADWGTREAVADNGKIVETIIVPGPVKDPPPSDAGEPDAGNNRTQSKSSSTVETGSEDGRQVVIFTVRALGWMGRIWLARNLGFGL